MRNIYQWRGKKNSKGLTLSDLLWENESIHFFILGLFSRPITFCIYWVFWEFSSSFEKVSWTFPSPTDILSFASFTYTVHFCKLLSIATKPSTFFKALLKFYLVECLFVGKRRDACVVPCILLSGDSKGESPLTLPSRAKRHQQE